MATEAKKKIIIDKVITSIDQITPLWLTSVLASSGALIKGAVAAFGMNAGRGNWSTNVRLSLQYMDGSQGALPQRLFLKMVNANLDDESFDSSEVNYYMRDYMGVAGVPLVHCYYAAFSKELQRYHVLLDDLSETHVLAEEKAPTLEYGLALADGLALMHARWWGAQRLAEAGAARHTEGHIHRFVDLSESGVGTILKRFSTELEPHWPETLRALYAGHPQAIITRNRNDNGFTLIHGDIGEKNVLVPRHGDRPIYIIDRQPFNWSLTTWLGVYDLAYAMVLDWEIGTRRRLEIPILKRYHDQLIKNGVIHYSWERLYADYRLCVAMCVYVATEYFRGDINSQWVHAWLHMLRRSLTACDDLACSELW
jgi:hypothetical protein